MNKDTSEVDILNFEIGGQTVRDMTALTFLRWLSLRLDGVKAYQRNTQDLINLVSNVPMGNRMPMEEKIRIIRRLIDLGIEIK